MLIKRLNDMPLRDKLMVSYFIILALALSIFGAFAFERASAVIKQQVQASTQQTVIQAKNNLQSYMRDVENVLMKIHVDSTVQNVLGKPQPNNGFQLNRDIKNLESAILGADIFRKKTSSIQLFAFNKADYPSINLGDSIFSSNDVEQEDWFRRTVEMGGKIYWYINGRQICSARLIIDVSDPRRVLGVVNASVDITQFLGGVDRIRIGKTGKVFLVNDDRIIAGTESELTRMLSNEPGFFSTIYENKQGSVFKGLNKNEYLIIYDELIGPKLKVVGTVPTSELVENIGIIRNALFLIAAISLIIAFLSSIFISYKISAPIYALADRMKSFDSDQYTKVPVYSNDEIGEIYNSFNKMLERIQQLIDEVNEQSRREKEAEMKALQAQINPHFLYNTLDSINWLAIKAGADDISLMVNSLANFLRFSLNKGREFISIANELEQVRSYIIIQKFRFKNKFDVIYHIHEEVLSYTIIKLTLQPLVENAINHGFDGIEYKGLIEIKAYKDEKYIHLQVNDNGKGADIDSLNKMLLEGGGESMNEMGYGIRNVNERLKLYFGEGCGLYFEDSQYGGITANIKVRAVLFGRMEEG
ncbi:sensor histidine kinase [Mahella australiensis]|uniref:Integral membrane sensor signal transduction histidine kinase n=1 Tax=Mahella australiensis (strain DSM 15567 / CIP 107919 / 50-1 BON) TaxID=697281 RepID=F3ZVL8_MAHA5|nr:sensor histidine kinase [Mahella australiensis]AEE96380.1 integral membrane sensor signal transduction histidine kinase [Mahella australiensis 50-1 BON]